MFAILSQLLFFLGLAIIIFLVARKIPKISADLDIESEQPLEVQIENHIGKSFFKIPWDKLDDTFERLIEKLMRRVHILILKIETLLQKKLESFKNKKKEKSLFIEEANGDVLIKQNSEIVDLSNIDLDNFEKLTSNTESNKELNNNQMVESLDASEKDDYIREEEKEIDENNKKFLNKKKSKSFLKSK